MGKRSDVAHAADQIELVRACYTPHLPEPSVGIHKEIAKELKLANTSVYLAIGQIRRDIDLLDTMHGRN